MAPDKYQVQKKLQDLGHDTEDVAASLLRLGCHGRVGDPNDCCLKRFLDRVMEPGHKIEVQSQWVDVDGVCFLDLPPACIGFVACFDDLRFPELVLPKPSEDDLHATPEQEPVQAG
jgi:hypothetical protein